MGIQTYYLTSRNNASNCKIRWDTVNREKLHALWPLYSCYGMIEGRPETLQELANEIDDIRLFGYLDTETFLKRTDGLSRHLDIGQICEQTNRRKMTLPHSFLEK